MAEITEAEFKELTKSAELYDCSTEAPVPCSLKLSLYAGIYEEGHPSNRIINVNKPWDTRVWWSLSGSLRESLCGYWCVAAHFESIGVGAEFNLDIPHFKFDCHHYHWSVVIPGKGIKPDDCTSPYEVIATVSYRNLCDKPGPIVGFCRLPPVQFFVA